MTDTLQDQDGAQELIAALTAERDYLRRQLDAANAGVPALGRRLAEAGERAAALRAILGDVFASYRRRGRLSDADIAAWRKRAEEAS